MSGLSISIAMCTYNGEQYVKDQLNSLAKQTRLPDEVVICDDRSSDGTVGVIKKYADAAPFPIELTVNQRRLGATRNYMQAIQRCGGDVIAFADQDDVSWPDRLQKTERAFSERPSLGAIFSDSIVVDERLQPNGYTLWQSIRFNEEERDAVRSGNALDVLMRYNVASGANMAFNARRYRDLVMPIPHGCLGDHWMALICAAIGELGMIEEPLIMYRQHEGQEVGIKGDGTLKGILAKEARKFVAGLRYLRSVRQSRMKEIDEALVLYGNVYARLLLRSCLKPDVGKQFEEKLAHLETRKKMGEKSRIHRIGPAIKELTEQRYRRYSNGAAYTMEDLLV